MDSTALTVTYKQMKKVGMFQKCNKCGVLSSAAPTQDVYFLGCWMMRGLQNGLSCLTRFFVREKVRDCDHTCSRLSSHALAEVSHGKTSQPPAKTV